MLEKYEVIPADERALYDTQATKVADFAKRRELKINQFKKEKDLRVRVEVRHCSTFHTFFLQCYGL